MEVLCNLKRLVIWFSLCLKTSERVIAASYRPDMREKLLDFYWLTAGG